MCPMRKGVAYMFRYRDVPRCADCRYLDALAVVADPALEVRELDRITRQHHDRAGRTARAINPLARTDPIAYASSGAIVLD